MEIFVQTKSVGGRKAPLERRPYTVPDAVRTLGDLVTAIVQGEVERYNSQDTDPIFCRFLTQQELEDRAQAGRISFGRLYSDRKANADAAVATALQGFADGLFRVVIEGQAIEALDAPLELHEGDTATFIRLTFLAGAFW